MKIIGIAGGSGSGKSTVSYALQDAMPDTIEVLNLDDYQKLASDQRDSLPKQDGMINWDHPDIIQWDNLIRDVKLLKSGQDVRINTWAHRSNPDYKTHRQMKPRTIYAKDILIVEGYLSLYDPTLRSLYDTSIYLDIDEPTRNQRRDKGAVVANPEYENKVLVPMHAKYVDPTRQFADHVVDVSKLSPQDVYNQIRTKLL